MLQADIVGANSLATSRIYCLKVLTVISKTNHTLPFPLMASEICNVLWKINF